MNTRHGTHVILGAITPAYNAADADILTYPHLQQSARLYSLPHFFQKNSLLPSKNDLQSGRFGENLKTAYLLTAAYRLQKAWSPTSKIFWSTQFTTTSVQLFGRPLSGELAKLAHDELRYYEKIASVLPTNDTFFDPILKAYGSLVTQRLEIYPSLEVRYKNLLHEVKDIFTQRYGDAFAVFDRVPLGTKLQPSQVHTLFTEALTILKQSDEDWKGWNVVQNNSAKLCVNLNRRIVVVGRRRATVDSGEIKGLFAHEVLVHARRSIEGRKRSRELGYGLPGYTAAEEGLGVLVESAMNGQFSPKIKDRYIDIALALGSSRRKPLSRQELFVVCFSREVIRGLVIGDETPLSEVEKRVWEHVNRIYRGSLGNRYVAVFTKDVSYYKGFVKIAKYLQKRSAKVGLEASLDYLMSGKFDPTIAAHRRALKESGH